MVLSVRPAAAIARAVSTIVSVPWVTTIARSRGAAAALHDRRAARVVHVQAVDHHHGLDRESSRARPSRSISCDVGVA